MNIEKMCTKCKVVKPLDAFAIRNDAPCGRASQCRICRMEYHYKNRDVILAKKYEYTKKNREVIRKKQRDMYAADPQKFKDKVAKYKAANIEKVQAKSYENREHHASRAAAYRAANPDKVRASKATRRARLVQAEGSYTSKDIEGLKRLQKRKCAVCRCDISKKYHIDHVIPLSKGGSNDKKNLQLLCPCCNQRKSSKDPILFMQSRGYLL